MAGIRYNASAIGILGETLDVSPLLSVTISNIFPFLLLWALMFGGFGRLGFGFGDEGLRIGI